MAMSDSLNPDQFLLDFTAEFGFDPTDEQRETMRALVDYFFDKHPRKLFILSGYAGTGKTAVTGAFIRTLELYKLKSRLLAPTGRAAKVLGSRAKNVAYTIHKQIYRRKTSSDEYSAVSLNMNLHKRTLFFVDEASMIADYAQQADGSITSRNLLNDLFEYVYSGNECALILIGDEGQLPPVGSDFSPALNADYLQHHYPLFRFYYTKLTSVVRQSADSGILWNATRLRSSTNAILPFSLPGFKDVIRLNGGEFAEELESSFDRVGQEETLVITRSNKWANQYNNQIRSRILWYEEQLCTGDMLMVVRNNYFWVNEESRMGFVANGETIQLIRLKKIEDCYGFQFAHATIRFVDYDDLSEMDVLLLLEVLQSDSPALPRMRMKELFFAIEQDYLNEKNKKKRYELILKNPYFNALQVKFAYTVTCHKSQGGQWAHVFIDQGYVDPAITIEDQKRWLYTAVTRATERVYLVNFPDSSFDTE
jgi:exodeoxyribonuclease-5